MAVSRRDFLKGGAVAAAAAAAVGVVGMSGCSSEEEGSSGSSSESSSSSDSSSSSSSESSEIKYEIYDCDVAVIGVGFSGLNAAWDCYEQGANVLVLDKGPYGHAGSAGMNWGLISDDLSKTVVDIENWKHYNVSFTGGIDNYPALANGTEEYAKLQMDARWVAQGCSLYQHNDDGTLTGGAYPNGLVAMYGIFTRHGMDEMAKMPISVLDWTMVTDIVIQDGRCVGLVAYHVLTGTYRVIRAKAVIGATPGWTRHFKWETVAPHSNTSMDNTGDVDAAALRHGLTIINAEFFEGDLKAVYPSTVCSSENGGFCADMSGYQYVIDSEGNHFLAEESDTWTQTSMQVAIAQNALEGKGSPRGGAWIEFNSEEAQATLKRREVYYRNVGPWKRMFDIDVYEDPVEVALDVYDSWGHPVVDGNFCTEVEGFYLVHGGGYSGRMYTSGSCVAAASCIARNAIDYIQNVDIEFNWEGAEDEIKRLDGIRTHVADDPLRPCEVHHAIQNTCGENLGVIRDADGLNECITELERIRDEDIPRMTLATQTLAYNTDWRQAIEAYNMLDLALCSAKSALEREESRNMHYRTDFPDMNNDDFLCQMAAVKGDDGEITITKRDIDFGDASREEYIEWISAGSSLLE